MSDVRSAWFFQIAVKTACAACGGLLVIVGSASAESPAAPAARPVVVEMFLSQSCKKSPPAAETLSEISRRQDVLALGYHVPYWNNIQAHNRGAWADPFARPEFAERQKLYNMRMRRTDVVYTPQAVIDGVFFAVGSKRDALDARITEAQFLDEHARASPPSLSLSRAEDDAIRVRIDRVGAQYDAFAISFRPKTQTEIGGGDNAGMTFEEINVVTGVAKLAENVSGAQTLSFIAPPKGEECAVLVHERGQGRIVAARYCDDPSAD